MKEKVLKIIYDYYKKTNFMPSIREVQKIMNYKYHNSIYKIFKQLEEDGILIHNKEKRKWSIAYPKDDFIKVKVLNEDKYITINRDKDKYTAYKIDNNHLKKDNILKNDYLIIKKTKYLNNNDLGLFVYNNDFHIMYYLFIDGFYMLTDTVNKEVLSKVKIIGKVIELQRKELIKKDVFNTS